MLWQSLAYALAMLAYLDDFGQPGPTLLYVCRIMSLLGESLEAAQALLKLQQNMEAAKMFEKAAATEADADSSAALLRQSARALLKSGSFIECFELALRHADDRMLFSPKVSSNLTSLGFSETGSQDIAQVPETDARHLWLRGQLPS